MSNFSYTDQLASLRLFSESMGILHEAQVMQLKYWGVIVFGGKSGWDCAVDFDNKSVNYRQLQPFHFPENFPDLVAKLDDAVSMLLGDAWTLNIMQGDEYIYKGLAPMFRTESK